MTHPYSEFNDIYEAGLIASKMKEAQLRRPRFYNLLQVFELASCVDGGTAEVGCFRGLSSWLMCHAMKTKDPSFTGKSHTIIDSFEGLSAPVKEDKVGQEFAGRFGDTSVAHVRQTLQDFPDISIVKGWVPAVFEALPEECSD